MRQALWLTASLILAAPIWAEDVVEALEGGKKVAIRGTIKEETPTEVVLDSAGKERRVSVETIESVRYDKQPAELIAVRSKERQGRWAEAAEDYKELGGKSVREDQTRLRDAIAASMFRCYAELAIADPAQADAALAWYQRAGDSLNAGRHRFATQELLGRMCLAKKDFPSAAAAFATLKEPGWPSLKAKAQVYEGTLLLAEGKAEAAIALFEQTLKDKSFASTEVGQRAAVYRSEALLKLGRAKEAEKSLRDLIESLDPEQEGIEALAHNALGEVMLAQQRPKEAMVDGFLWVLVVYPGEPNELARALFHLSRTFPQIGEPERGEQLASRLKSDFPQSRWSKMLTTTGSSKKGAP